MAAIAPLFPAQPSVSTQAAPERTGCDKLWLCCHLPEMALEVVLQSQAFPPTPESGDPTETPAAVFENIKGKPQVAMATHKAQDQGVRPGLGVNAALAVCPQLQLHDRQPHSESLAMTSLAEHCLAFTPWVSLALPQSLLLEVQGSLALFGGLETLSNQLKSQIRQLGHTCVIAVAPSSFASWLLASQGMAKTVKEPAGLRSALGELPITALGVDDKLRRRLAMAGLHTLRDLWRLPREGLQRRYGRNLVTCLDRALGQTIDLPVALQPSPRFHAAFDLPLESPLLSHCWPFLGRLIDELMQFLHARDGAITGLQLKLKHRAVLPDTLLSLELRKPSRDRAYITLLLREKLERTPLPAPVRSLVLTTVQVHRFIPETPDLFGHRQADADAWEQLLETLQTRLGKGALRFLAIREDHRPERAFVCSEAPLTISIHPLTHPRPLWLLRKPQPAASKLIWNTATERIESGWWDGEPIRRDYRSATDRQGRRWWAYRDLSDPGRWYLQGLFG